jgi:hypothetical protein
MTAVVVVRPLLPITGPVIHYVIPIEWSVTYPKQTPVHQSDPYHWNARGHVSLRSSFDIQNGKIAVLDFDSHSPVSIRLRDQNVCTAITFGGKNDPFDISLKSSATKFIAEEQFC